MKKLLLTFALVMVSCQVQAQVKDTYEETCERLATAAETMMKVRQIGGPMSNLMRIAGDDPILRKMVIEAYKEPRWPLEEFQARAADEHRDRWYMICITKGKSQ